MDIIVPFLMVAGVEIPVGGFEFYESGASVVLVDLVI